VIISHNHYDHLDDKTISNTFPFTIDLSDVLDFFLRSQQELGTVEEIQHTFVDFQQHLYQEAVGL